MSLDKPDIPHLKRLMAAATPPPWNDCGKDGITQTQHLTRDVWRIPRTVEDVSLIVYLANHAPALVEAMEQHQHCTEIVKRRDETSDALRAQVARLETREVEALESSAKLRAQVAKLLAENAELREALTDVAGFDSCVVGLGLCWCRQDSADCVTPGCINARSLMEK